MLIRHLSYFVTLAHEKHFARAAEACNVAQPTLSAAIRKLEENLGVQLVIRGHQFVGLTPEGERLLAWGRKILTDYNSLRDDLSQVRKGLVGTLRLGVIPAAMPSVAPLTKIFRAAHPAADVAIRSLSSRAIQSGLDDFELDGGVTYLENEPLENVRRIPLYQERYVFVTHRDHRFAGRSSIGWAEAAEERLCLLSGEMQNRRVINNVCASLGVVLDAPVVSNSFLGVYSHLRQGGWSSIVPHTFAAMFGGLADIVSLDLIDPVHTQLIGLVLSNRQPPTPMASALLALFLDGDLEIGFPPA
jgi:DNA-binding transcriptional LysR family regulator